MRSPRTGTASRARSGDRPGPAGRRLLAGAAVLLAASCGGAEVPEGASVELSIPEGASVLSIGRQLDSAGLIDHPRLFAAYVRWKGAEAGLKAGRYVLAGGSSYGELLRVLRTGEVVTTPLTVPEGLTVPEVATRIAAYAGQPADSVLALLGDTAWVRQLGLPGPTFEGYLFPETYRFAEGIGPRFIISTMVERYRDFWGEEERARAEALGLDEREVVTLASIVEEEARIPDERPVIAEVYLNRLEIGMALQADPTVQYALQEPRARLLFRDIEAVADHPYNTYTHAGLPPGPIASPGAAALRATLEPAEHDFLFFVARPDGSHEFTRTAREHVNAVNRIRRERDGTR